MTDETFALMYGILEHLRLNGPRSLKEIYSALCGVVIDEASSHISSLQSLVQCMVGSDMLTSVPSTAEPLFELTKEGSILYYKAKKTLEKQKNNKPVNFQLSTPKQYESRYAYFMTAYSLVDAFLPLGNKTELQPKSERICRFCGKKASDVSFKDAAHLIPESLGNKIILSDFECDECNHFFGNGCDNHLANYQGIQRTLAQTRGKDGIPSFTAPGKQISAKSKFIANEPAIVVTREDTNNETITVDASEGLITLKYTKNPYKKLMVYKACLKIALSSLPESEMVNYRDAIKLLMGRRNFLKTGYTISGYQMGYPMNMLPHIFVFEKKDPAAHIPTHLVAIYFSNAIYAIPVPLHKEDVKKWKKDPTFQLPLYPPLFTQFTNMDDLIITPFKDDFSSEETVTDDQQEIVLKIAAEDVKNMMGINRDGEQTYLKMGDSPIAKLLFTKYAGPIDLQTIQNLLSEK